MRLPGPLLISIERLLNEALDTDEDATTYLEPLAGHCIALKCFPFEIFCLFDAHGVSLLNLEPEHVSTRIVMNAGFVLQSVSGSEKFSEPFKPSMSIEGKMKLAQQLGDLVQNIQVDWVAMLAPWVGESAAYYGIEALKSLREWGENQGQSMIQNLGEYLQEEWRLVPARAEVSNFEEQLGVLVSRVDRLSQVAG